MYVQAHSIHVAICEALSSQIDMTEKTQTWAASEIKSKTKSLPDIVSHISPKVPVSSVNPAARASANEREPFLRPICIVKHYQKKGLQ